MIEILSENGYAQAMRETVEPALSAMREDVYLPLQNGGSLHVECYEKADAERAVVVFHGYTESAEKFREMIWYYINEGFSVFAPDHRGHGQSVRQVQPTWLTHVDRFEDYLNDVDAMMEQIVLPRTKGKTLTLYAHSMGGAIGAMTLIRHPDWFARAVLTAPMIAPVTGGLPKPVTKAITGIACALGMNKKTAISFKPFDPASETFEKSFATSRARFEYYEAKRLADPNLQNCSPTYSWVREAVGVTDFLLSPENTKKIRTPLMLCQAGQDTIVKLPEQNQFVSQVAGAKLVRFDTARHEIYCSDNATVQPYVNQVIGFLKGE